MGMENSCIIGFCIMSQMLSLSSFSKAWRTAQSHKEPCREIMEPDEAQKCILPKSGCIVKMKMPIFHCPHIQSFSSNGISKVADDLQVVFFNHVSTW